MKKLAYLISSLCIFSSCQTNDRSAEELSPINQIAIESVIGQLTETVDEKHHDRLSRGVKQVAGLWRKTDGDENEFKAFCMENFIGSEQELDMVFERLGHYFEHLYGYLNRITLEMNRQLHEDRGPIHRVDQLFGAYSSSAHVADDLYKNKIAFIIALNFPNYSFDEKNALGGSWGPRQWGYARLGNYFTERVPPALLQELSQINSASSIYIASYNIFAGKLVNNQGKTLFPENMKLLAHWNIRDEIKSNYGQPGGLEKKELLYQVMLRIINQDIPKEVINNEEYTWNPVSNEVWKDGETIQYEEEGLTRYEHLLANFRGLRKTDPYYPEMDTYIKRRFDGSMEIPQEEVEALFREYAASPLLREVGKLISQRLGRELRPFDIWYDGFMGRGSISEEELDAITKKRYPDAEAMNRNLPLYLRQLGFDPDKAEFIASKIEVDAARGSGHAWRTSMRSKPSHLRTRIGKDGMDYKGYNIAIHEYGHNVEQTISTHFVDNYFINGIPNTAFTEALAFMFQRRDLDLLGISYVDPLKEHFEVLDVFWDNYEMMGVSLLDMEVWKWMYANPDASAADLKQAVIRLAKEIWNEYFADVFGVSDTPVLAIYSHMIQSPLYLSNYPYGRLIMFQIEDYIRDKDFAGEVLRIFSLGRLTPRRWMEQAVGQQISNQPVFDAVEKALAVVGAD